LKKQRVAMLSIYSNSTLVVLKLVVGITMMSVSVLSEAIHSMIDLVAAIIANYSVRKSAIPRTRTTPMAMGNMRTMPGWSRPSSSSSLRSSSSTRL